MQSSSSALEAKMSSRQHKGIDEFATGSGDIRLSGVKVYVLLILSQGYPYLLLLRPNAW